MTTDPVLNDQALTKLEAEMRAIKQPDLPPTNTPEQREQLYKDYIARLQNANLSHRKELGILHKQIRAQQSEISTLKTKADAQRALLDHFRRKTDGRPGASEAPFGGRRYSVIRQAIRFYWQIARLEWTDGTYANCAIAVRRQMVWEAHSKDDTVACTHCGKLLPPDEFTVDHMKPVSLGGGDEPGNLRPSCEPCNRLRPNFDLSTP